MPGMAGVMETDIVTTAGSGGAMKTAFCPGSMDVMPPPSTSQRILALAGMEPSSVNEISSPTSNLQSCGRMVTDLAGMATAPEVVMTESATNTAAMITTLRGINILGFYEDTIWIPDEMIRHSAWKCPCHYQDGISTNELSEKSYSLERLSTGLLR
jgi:hypothetical protein